MAKVRCIAVFHPGTTQSPQGGKGAQTGVGLAEIYDVDRANANSRLANVSTRGITRGGEDVLIAGFIVTGNTRKKVVVRGIAPSLKDVTGTIKQPVISMYDEQGSMLERNAGWKSSGGAAQVANYGLAPSDDREDAIYASLRPGGYTVVCREVSGATGVALVEVYALER
ncbi:MAG: hypothetical protein H0X73_05160 [Chthoniobacterales bacterium]|nr:hypothetical protein [Chthoniobacterales bacterium]